MSKNIEQKPEKRLDKIKKLLEAIVAVTIDRLGDFSQTGNGLGLKSQIVSGKKEVRGGSKKEIEGPS